MKPFVLFLGLVFLTGCTPKAPATKSLPNPAPEVRGPAAPGPQGQPPVPGPTLVSRPAVAVTPPPRPFDESVLRGKEFLLEPSKVPAPGIRDRSLGPLGTRADLSAAVGGFFAGAAQGNVEDSSLVPRWKDFLEGAAKRLKAEGWSGGTVRTGTEIPDQGDGWLVPVRATSGGKQWSGWMALVAEGKAILVSDLQVEGADLVGAPFDPESSGQEISSPSRR